MCKFKQLISVLARVFLVVWMLFVGLNLAADVWALRKAVWSEAIIALQSSHLSLLSSHLFCQFNKTAHAIFTNFVSSFITWIHPVVFQTPWMKNTAVSFGEVGTSKIDDSKDVKIFKLWVVLEWESSFYLLEFKRYGGIRWIC